MGSFEDEAYWSDKYAAPPDCGICEYGCDCDDSGPPEEGWSDCEYCGPWHDAEGDDECDDKLVANEEAYNYGRS